MSRLRFLTAGESHGQALTVIIEGLPARLPLTADFIDARLASRQQGYGRGGRMDIERDRVTILAGVRHGRTLGSPLALLVANRDWPNWRAVMATEGPPPQTDGRQVTAARPGHADLAGGMKYDTHDLRDILERASARETAARVAGGAVFQALLGQVRIGVLGFVRDIGGVTAAPPMPLSREQVEASSFRCPDPQAEERYRELVDEVRAAGDTLGGIIEIHGEGIFPGLGSHVHWDRRLDARCAAALMSIPGIKGVSIGEGFAAARLRGTVCHDEIVPDAASAWRYRRVTNRAGGVEGGMSNGEPLVLQAAMKPIPTTGRPLRTVDVGSRDPVDSHHERSDICAVPAASVVGEAMIAFVLAEACLEQFGGDTLEDFLAAVERYRARLMAY